MSIETTLYSTLADDAAVSALVSDRIYPMIAPDSAAVPYITYQVVATDAHNVLSGAPNTERKIIQVNCISNSYAEAKSIAAAAKASINVIVGYLNGSSDDYFPQTQKHRVSLDFALIG